MHKNMGIFSKTNEAEVSAPEKKSETKKKTAKPAVAKEKKSTTKGTGHAHRILIKPLITEKAGFLGHENKYVFEVAVDANKIEIAKAVEEVYSIKPVAVNVINRDGKKVRRGREFGRRKDWKKAIVELPEGKTINIYEGV